MAMMLGLWLLAAFGACTARAESYWDLEHARANARAGGPVSEQDAELLERWGCLSGTRSAFCERLEAKQRARYRATRKAKRD
jgi:hypothetical protein